MSTYSKFFAMAQGAQKAQFSVIEQEKDCHYTDCAALQTEGYFGFLKLDMGIFCECFETAEMVTRVRQLESCQ